DEVAWLVGIDSYKIYPWRGDYFRVNLPYSVKKLVYPVIRPQKSHGLGVHLTRDGQGRYMAGPDVQLAASKEDFSSGEYKKDKFYEALRFMFHDIRKGDLSYEMCGIRPKLRAPNETQEKDFVIAQDLPGFINLVGIESPGLTSALAIAQKVKIILK
ncbi:MAG: FAD-dependent oxidoreductase, partial [Deltaproteobacteria bacterium]|nr:FAD-dependent oxidoreductase [Deltaproteobacteria bacterium]